MVVHIAVISFFFQVVHDLEVEMVEQEFLNEKRASAREFEEHKVYFRENIIAELEEKQKMIETERHNMELLGDSMELKPISTRSGTREEQKIYSFQMLNHENVSSGSSVVVFTSPAAHLLVTVPTTRGGNPSSSTPSATCWKTGTSSTTSRSSTRTRPSP